MNPIPRLEIVETHFIRAKIDSARKDGLPRYRHRDRQNDRRDDSLEQEFRDAVHGLDILGQRQRARNPVSGSAPRSRGQGWNYG